MVSMAMVEIWVEMLRVITTTTAKMETQAKERDALRMTLRAVTSNVITAPRPIYHTLLYILTLSKSTLKALMVSSELHQQVAVEEAVLERT